MSKSSYLQSSFLGGVWAAEVQGRQDSDQYKAAMNACVNYYPIEQGSLTRRQGTEFIGHTKAGNLGRITDFDLSNNPLQLEFTSGWIRFIKGNSFLGNGDPLSVVSISSATPALVTTAAHGYSTGDTVFFTSALTTVFGPLFFRQFVATVVDATTFTIADALTGASFDGSTIPAFSSGDYNVTRIAELASPYTSTSWSLCTFLQDDAQLLIFHPTIATRVITQVGTGFGFAIGLYAFADGPYLDINTTSTTLTPSGTSGSINITASAVTGINPTLATPAGTGFQSTDVGRHIRLYLAPAAWDKTSDAYVIGDMVTYTDGNFYVALKNDNGPADNNGIAAIPTNIDHWALLGYIPTWVWALVTAVTSTTIVVATIEKSATSTNTVGFNILPTKIWRLGAYSGTTSFPSIGEWHEGRLWLAGAIVNRFDGSMADDSYSNFAPTYDDGTVADNNGIQFTVKSNEKNAIVWMSSNDSGILFGTQSSEWKLRASTLDDPMTPSSMQARRQSKYGSDAIAINVGKFNLFIQRAKRKVMEIVFGNSANEIKVTNLSLTASHLTVGGLEEIRFAKEPKPTVWSRTTDGRLCGMTYIRDDETLHAGWHNHPLGHTRLVDSISAGPSVDQLTDHLYLITHPASGSVTRYVERLTDVFDDNKKDFETFFLDGAIQTPYWKVATVITDGFAGILAYGYWAMIGNSLAGTFGALDMGDAVVAADGSISYPFTAATGFTAQYVTDTLALQPDTRINPVIGFAYTSQGQLLRPDHGNDAGARSGPAFGKKRRNHWFAVLLNRTQAMKFGTDFGSTLKPAKIATPGGTPIVQPTLFSGIYTDTITDDYSFDGMISWQQTRPLPGQILAVAGYIEVHDK